MDEYIIAIDQGTTSARAVVFNKAGQVVSVAQKELRQIYPKKGYVEQDVEEILQSQIEVLREAVKDIDLSKIKAIGIANQRETTIIWDKKTNKPIYNAIVWQCKRTKKYCDSLKTQGLDELIKDKTGLVVDPYFSATKILWILDNVNGAREKANKGELLFGTVDSFLIYNLTKEKVHVTDYSNASRTMLLNIETLKYDEELLELFNIPQSILPKIKDSSEVYGMLDKCILGVEIPITAAIGDQQAALFGQKCFEIGKAKNTYGTGCFVLMNVGDKVVKSKNGLLSTIAWRIKGKVTYALEGSVFTAGATVEWLKNQLKLIDSVEEIEEHCLKAQNNNGVYLVPAFSGLGAPIWDMTAQGIIVGLTLDVNKSHIIRAAIEAIAYQTKDLINAMEVDSGIQLKQLKVDGGASKSNFLMQFQADLLNVPIKRAKMVESTALGVAFLAGLAVGFWSDLSQLGDIQSEEFNRKLTELEVSRYCKGWERALEKVKNK